MSYLKHSRSICGRFAKRPKSSNIHEDSEDEDHLPMQTQIDNLRAKISLKQRYNKALQEEYTESHRGAHQMIHELITDNDILRHDRNDAFKSGNSSAVKALRNHRTFLLALRGRSPEQVLDWLDDQIGDQRKLLDKKLDMVTHIKCRLSEAERMVEDLESFPFPGSSPWEQEFIEDFTRLGVAIANQEALRDCVNILGKTYTDILTDLKDARDKWPYSVKKMELAYRELKGELGGLQSMLNDALRLKKNTYYRLAMTEKEYVENRKIRHHRIAKIRKMAQKELLKNDKKYRKTIEDGELQPRSKLFSTDGHHSRIIREEANTTIIQHLQEKRDHVHEYEERARTLVNAMRVKDLRYCPQRIRTVAQLGRILGEEQFHKEAQLEELVVMKSNLLLIKNQLSYTGCTELEQFEKNCKDKAAKIRERRSATKVATERLNKIGDRAVTLHASLLGLLRNLQEGKKFHHQVPADYVTLGKIVLSKIKILAAEVKALEANFHPDDEPQKNYTLYVKQTIPRDACRLGTHHKGISDDESSDDDDAGMPTGIGNDRVLSRDDIKAKSNKIYAQGVLRKGFEDGSIVKKTDARIRKKISKKFVIKH